MKKPQWTERDRNLIRYALVELEKQLKIEIEEGGSSVLREITLHRIDKLREKLDTYRRTK